MRLNKNIEILFNNEFKDIRIKNASFSLFSIYWNFDMPFPVLYFGFSLFNIGFIIYIYPKKRK